MSNVICFILGHRTVVYVGTIEPPPEVLAAMDIADLPTFAVAVELCTRCREALRTAGGMPGKPLTLEKPGQLGSILHEGIIGATLRDIDTPFRDL